MTLKLPDPSRDLDNFNNYVRNTAKNLIKDTMGTWYPIEFSKTSRTKRLRFMLNPEGQTMGEILRHPDDSISEHCADPSHCSKEDILHPRVWMYKDLHTDITAELLRTASTDWDPLKTGTILAHRDTASSAAHTLSSTANNIIETCVGAAKLPRGVKLISQREFLTTTNRLIRDQMLHPSLRKLVATACRRQHPQAVHNAFAKNPQNLPALFEMANAHTNAFQTAVRHLPVEELTQATADQLASQTMDILGLTQDHWELFLKMAPFSNWPSESNPTAIGQTVKMAETLPHGPNTPNVLQALASLTYHIPRILETPGETLHQWNTLLNFLCSQTDLPPEATSKIVRDTPWQITGPNRDSKDWKAPATAQECLTRYNLTQ